MKEETHKKQLTEEQQYFEDLTIVMHHLRHSCNYCRKVKDTVPVIMRKTKLSEKRVLEMLEKIKLT